MKRKLNLYFALPVLHHTYKTHLFHIRRYHTTRRFDSKHPRRHRTTSSRRNGFVRDGGVQRPGQLPRGFCTCRDSLCRRAFLLSRKDASPRWKHWPAQLWSALCTESEGRCPGQVRWAQNNFCDQPNDVFSMGPRSHFALQHLCSFRIKVPVCESCPNTIHSAYSRARSVMRSALGFSSLDGTDQIVVCNTGHRRSWCTGCLSCRPTRRCFSGPAPPQKP